MSEEASSSAMDESNVQEPKQQEEELDDEDLYCMDSYHNAGIGGVLDKASSRFRILKKLGQGQFSNVWLCKDNAESRFVAVKVGRSKSYYNECSFHEINMLKKIHNADPSDRRRERIVKLLEYFTMPGKVEGKHVCLVYETIGNDLFTFIRERYSNGAPIAKVKNITCQILEGVDYLHTKCGIIHTDLKPENILICFDKDDVEKLAHYANHLEIPPQGEGSQVNEKAGSSSKMTQETGSGEASGSDSNSGDSLTSTPVDLAFTLNLFSNNEIFIKITDFGNSCTIVERLSSHIQTRHYRSPEILIGAEYSTPIDIWSIGCIAYELATGTVLFNPPSIAEASKDELHLGLMVQMLGNVPKHVRDTGPLSAEYFSESGQLINVDTSKHFSLAKRLMKINKWASIPAQQFSEFLLIMLQFDPMRRATAGECLRHRWLNK